MSSTAAASKKNRTSLGDSLAVGVLVMLLVNVVQRCFGLFRGVGFAHFLTDVDLGHWALIQSFFVVAVPLAVLGLPGSFGKFAEYFRVRKQFGSYFRVVSILSCVGVSITCVGILLIPDWSWRLVFKEWLPDRIVWWCVLVLLSVIAFSFVSELSASFREVRTVSQMQFLQSVTFTLSGLIFVAIHREWWVLLPCFAISQCVGLWPGLWRMRTRHAAEFQNSSTGTGHQIWRRVAPYALTLWAINLFTNLFEVTDRYMLLHLTSSSSYPSPQALVGQYHCARILPNLLSSVASMLGGVLLPYLSADWEANRRETIAAKIRQMTNGLCAGFMILSVAALVASPLLFQFIFRGRYDLAEQVLPIALLQATWLGMFLIAETYLLCAERGSELVGILMTALAANVAANSLLIPTYGLPGGMLATAFANYFALGLLYWRVHRAGCRVGRGPQLLALAPVCLLLGPVVTCMLLVTLVVIAGRTNWLLTDNDRAHIDAVVLPRLNRIGLRLNSVWPV